jgi:hypothetical protein
MAALTEKEVRDALSQDAFTRPIAEDRNRNPAWFEAVMIGVRLGEKHALEEALNAGYDSEDLPEAISKIEALKR